nr:reverse transcriptase domain-containing protein [Tanacetum cinerariifolium]
MDECLALADLSASINLMPLSVWSKLSLPELSSTYMTLELADRSISRPVGVTEDVFVKVETFHFSTDFVVVDFDADPRVPLILKRSFLKTERALIDVYEGELTLRVGNKAITFNLDQTARYSANYNAMSINRIDVIDVACEEYSQDIKSSGGVFMARKPLKFLRLATIDPPGDIMARTALPKRDGKCAFKENLHTSKQTITLKCLEASSQNKWFNSEKLVDLDVNHKFRRGLLGIKLITLSKVGSSKRAAEAKLDYEGSKRQKTNEASVSVREQPDVEENELSQENLQQMMMVEFKRLFVPDTDDTLWKLLRDGKCAFKENLHTSKQTITLKCLEASSQNKWFNSEKLVDLDVNHKFRRGLLGIKLITLSSAKGRVCTGKLSWYCQS